MANMHRVLAKFADRKRRKARKAAKASQLPLPYGDRFFVQFRQGGRVLPASTLQEAIATGLHDRYKGSFDVSKPNGSIVWAWEMR